MDCPQYWDPVSFHKKQQTATPPFLAYPFYPFYDRYRFTQRRCPTLAYGDVVREGLASEVGVGVHVICLVLWQWPSRNSGFTCKRLPEAIHFVLSCSIVFYINCSKIMPMSSSLVQCFSFLYLFWFSIRCSKMMTPNVEYEFQWFSTTNWVREAPTKRTTDDWQNPVVVVLTTLNASKCRISWLVSSTSH